MLAEQLEYSISGTTKAELITSFLSAQSADEAAEEAGADADDSGDYSQEELEALTIYEIKDLAESFGYTITGNTKAKLIESFLEAQAAAADDDENVGG